MPVLASQHDNDDDIRHSKEAAEEAVADYKDLLKENPNDKALKKKLAKAEHWVKHYARALESKKTRRRRGGRKTRRHRR